ncbi:MAG: DNA-3-methyladenine glycosylase I [Aquimonas sp.]|nr:DNA-3-methyladenine glycosylase I [Xanthomonadales bacterium]MCC6505057.1 DNA-3-methyladenine glycosylase I [Aquimonas sp.]
MSTQSFNPEVDGVIPGSDGCFRCWWHGGLPDYARYHDHEWGHPVADDRWLFEKICLEGFQSGLSWLTILRKREHFRAAFANFDIEQLAQFGESDVARLLQDAGIVRHRGKIEAVLNNARRALELRDDTGSLAAFFWRYEPDSAERPKQFDRPSLCAITQSPSSLALSKALKKRGWAFVGPTTMYAFMQSAGMVNDHMAACDFRMQVEQARAEFQRPR